MQYRTSHIFVGNAVYDKDSKTLDLRGADISAAHFDSLRAQLPECDILWDVPFQGSRISSDTAELTITALTDDDIAMLDYLTGLTAIRADGCTDYAQLLSLQQRHPDCSISYQVTIGADSYPNSTTALTFSKADPEELLEKLQYLPHLESVHFIEPAMEAESLLQLRERYPGIGITWELEVLGVPCRDDAAELDFSGTPLESVEELEQKMAYFPNLEKLILCDCGIDNETMAAFRERVREDYKVVWSVQIYRLTVRTDDVTFMPVKYDIYVTDVHTHDLVYCEDMLCVDLGHHQVKNIDWIYGMPKLQYLILADTWVNDITPIATLKDLIYLELFKTDITDYTPLTSCTALEDVNLAYTRGDASVLSSMTWLNNLWINQCKVDDETRQLLTESLPDTFIEFDHGWHMGNNWRSLPNYFKMRDLLEMPYYDWGNELGRPGDPGYPYEENDA